MFKSKTYALTCTAFFTALIILCAWISIPASIPFTMQTFAIFTALGTLGGKYGTLSILSYIILGALGLPVFSGFGGGFGILFGATGGYILGFLFSGLLMWAIQALFGRKPFTLLLSMVLGLILCYAFGTSWYLLVYTQAEGAVSVGTVLGLCVVPFILPDLLKIALAYFISRRLYSFVHRQ